MKACLRRFRNSKGFTLIELLVVIGILGILAAALIATIDPFEQLKKADDSKVKNMLVEFQNANVRYYTTHTAFPWNDTSTTHDATCFGLAATSFSMPLYGAAAANEMTSCIGAPGITNTLIGEGELKSSFTSNVNDLKRVHINWDVDNQSELVVCFAPTSKSQKASVETIYDETGAPAAVGLCPSAAAADGVCWWCSR